MWKNKNTIRGPYPAVCFTDQPLSAFIQSCAVLPKCYHPYGVALEKRNLFTYGGRPVIYGDENLLARLHDDDKYLWVRYDPIPNDLYHNSPNDWTHEREWRARVKKYHIPNWGYAPDDGVPLIMPPGYSSGNRVVSLPRILVRTLKEATELRDWFVGLPEYEGTNGFIKELYIRRTELKIIPLDLVSERLKAGDDRWARLDTLPYEEILSETE